jgi:DNA-binding NarL/FixJ family response regulator
LSCERDSPDHAVTITVLITDDQALVRAGFRMILEAEADFEVVGEAGDGAQAVDLASRVKPDIVLMDVRMPALDGLQAARRVLDARGAASKVVMLSTFDIDEYVYEALQIGASGFMLKDVPPESSLLACARSRLETLSWLPP